MRLAARTLALCTAAPTHQLIEVPFPDVTIPAAAKLIAFEIWSSNVADPPGTHAFVWSIEITYD